MGLTQHYTLIKRKPAHKEELRPVDFIDFPVLRYFTINEAVILKKSTVFFVSLAIVALLAVFSRWSFAANNVTLKVYEGYKFSSGSVTKSEDKSADLSFFVNMGRMGASSFALGALGAKKIKEFGENKPGAAMLTLQEASSWKKYANAPSGGYYGVLGADGQSLYLVRVLSFKNQGKASSFWELTFTWQKI